MAKSLDVVVAIAAIANKGCIIGYRLAHVFEDKTESDIKNIPTRNIIDAIEQGMEVENMIVVKGKLYGSQGDLLSLPVIDLSGRLLAGSKITIAYKIGDVGYRVLNYAGKALKLRDDEIIEALRTNKISGLTNAKIVTDMGIAQLAAINGEFRQVRLKNTAERIGRIKSSDLYDKNSDKVKYSSTVSMNNAIVRNEIEYNDSFYQLTKEQRYALESYYTWWTSETFKSLSEGGRAELQSNPKKVAQLAELRGKGIKWTYEKSLPARLINKQGFDYCTLGHKLQMVHFAKGIDEQGNVYQIKFGSTCAADFFDISPKSMATLQKVSDTMKEEIELAVHEVGDPELLKAKINELKTMRGIFANYPDALVMFGQNLTKFGYAFMKSGLPFPASFLALCRQEAYRYAGFSPASNTTHDTLATYKVASNLYGLASHNSELGDIVYTTLAGGSDRDLQAFAIMLVEPGLEGCYGYDPFNKIGERGKGRFDASARSYYAARQRYLRRFNCTVKDDLAREFCLMCEYLKLSMNLTHKYLEDVGRDLYNELKNCYEATHGEDSGLGRLSRTFAWIVGEAMRTMKEKHKGEDTASSIISMFMYGISRYANTNKSVFKCLDGYPMYNSLVTNTNKLLRSDRKAYLEFVAGISDSEFKGIVREFISEARESSYFKEITGGMDYKNLKLYGNAFESKSLDIKDADQFKACLKMLLEEASSYSERFIRVVDSGDNLFSVLARIACYEYLYGPEKIYEVISVLRNDDIRSFISRNGLTTLKKELHYTQGKASCVKAMASFRYLCYSVDQLNRFIRIGSELAKMSFAVEINNNSEKAISLLRALEMKTFKIWAANGYNAEDSDAIELSRTSAAIASIEVCGLLGLYGWTHSKIDVFYPMSKPTFIEWDQQTQYWMNDFSNINYGCESLIKKDRAEESKTSNMAEESKASNRAEESKASNREDATEKKSDSFNNDINNIYKQSRSLSDSDNWKKTLGDEPEIKRAVDILAKVDEGLLPPFINKVLNSVKRKGECSYKQWMYLRAFANQYRGEEPEIKEIKA